MDDTEKARHFADKKVKKGIIDQYYIVQDYAKTALEFFIFYMESFQGGITIPLLYW